MTAACVTLITGERGAGKSTLCDGLHHRARDAGQRITGVISLAVFDGCNEKIGVDAFNITTRRTDVLARKDGSIVGSRWACYTFSDDTITECVASTVQALDGGVDLLILDEIGPLELSAGKGFRPILRFLECNQLPRQTIVAVRCTLAQDLECFFRQLDAHPSTRVIEVRHDNRNRLLDQLYLTIAVP